MPDLLSHHPRLLSIQSVFFFVSLLCLAFFIRRYFNRRLDRFPGPVAAKFTQLWLLHDTWRNRSHLTELTLHEKHGNIVRLGPNIISLADPSDIKLVYGFGKNFTKSEFYEPMRTYRVKANVFTERDPHIHAALKKPVLSAYSMTSLTNYEPYIDEQIRTFLHRLEEEFVTQFSDKRPCEMAEWFQYFAFDAIASITWGRDMGFMKQARDVGDTIEALRRVMEHRTLVGRIPLFDTLFTKNPVALYLFGQTSRFVPQALALIKDRREQKGASHNDFLQTFVDLREKKPDVFAERDILGVMIANILAGSDTTAISLRATLYYVLHTSGVLSRLMRELEYSELSMPVTWKESQQLPYLDACIKEALRLHPPVGISLERLVPSDGLTLTDGTYIHPGTVVGMNAWVVHKNKAVFGADAGVYNPDRWLRQKHESEEAFDERFNTMRRHDMTFGYGDRGCLGKNISLMEIYKVFPSVLLQFDVQLADPEKEWTTWNRFFVFQKDLWCTLQKREKTEDGANGYCYYE